MKHPKLWLLIPVTVALCVLPARATPANDCDNSPRNIGPFGALGNNQPVLSLSPEITAKLPHFKKALRQLDTNLAGPDEQMIVYNTSGDESDPHPRVAFLANGKLAKLFDATEFAPSGGGFENYLASCRFEVTAGQPVIAIALSTAGDGTGSAFAIIQWQSGSYRIVFSRLVSEGRIEFEDSSMKLWSRSFSVYRKEQSEMDECEWCPHRYNITEYHWQNGRYLKTGSLRTKRAYDPAEITGKPLIVQKH